MPIKSITARRLNTERKTESQVFGSLGGTGDVGDGSSVVVVSASVVDGETVVVFVGD